MMGCASNSTQTLERDDRTHANLMPESTAACSDSNQTPARWWIGFELQGDLKFISHHDTLRLFRRALARADLPVRYSEGFNPHPKMTAPLPRPVGVSSEAEAIIVDMVDSVTETVVVERLAAQMPAGLTMRGARRLDPGERPQPEEVTYRYCPEVAPGCDVTERMERLIQATELVVERQDAKTKHRRSVDIRPYLLNIRQVDRNVEFTLRVTGAGTAKPSEIVALLYPGSGPPNHRIHRLSVRWRQRGN